MINQAARKKSWSWRPKWMERFAPRFRITRLGWGLILMSILIAGAAFNTGTNLLYLMFSTLAGMTALNSILSVTNSRKLKAIRILPGEVYADQPCRIRYELINQKRLLASYGITLEEGIEHAKPGRISSYFLSIGPGEKSFRESEIIFERRGWARFEIVTVRSRFPFGLDEYCRRSRMETTILVYPKIVPVAPILKKHNAEMDARPSRLRGAGSDLYSIRQYQQGDPARSIHWKHTSKGTGVKIREFEREESQRIRIILNPVIAPQPSPAEIDQLEEAISVAASLCRHFIRLGHETALWTPAGSLIAPADSGRFRPLMTLLAKLELDTFLSKPERLSPPPGEWFLDLHVPNTKVTLN